MKLELYRWGTAWALERELDTIRSSGAT